MATERQSPDILLDQTNLSGLVTVIQDDPDSPDGNWLTAISNNADSICRISFPTPTANPTVGADLQEFKIWVRKMGGTGTPKVRIELYENASLLATLLPDTDVTSATGVLHSGTWNASLLGTADGSLVECRVYGTKSGGGPAVRATIEIGAVEWNVTYSTTVTVTPGTGNLTTTSYTPTVSVTDHKTVSPGTASLASLCYVAFVVLGTIITPNAGSAITTCYTPIVDISDNIIVVPDALSLLIAPFESSIVLGKVIVPDIVSLNLVMFIPEVAVSGGEDITVIPDTESLLLTFFILKGLHMSITTNNIVVVKTPMEGDEIVASLYSADLMGGEDLIAAITGKCIYVRKIQIFSQSVDDITFDLGAAQDTGVTTIYLGPIPLPDAGGTCIIDFGPEHSMKVASATAFSIDTSAVCPASVLVWYKIAS